MPMPLVNHIMLADDDRDHAFLFELVLKQVDPSKSLSVAYDGEQLFAMLARVQPEILFLDLNMPCKNGIECLQEIRNTPELKDLKVVVYSSSAKMSDIKRSYLHKADLYIVKPFHTEHLKNALDIVLRKEAWEKASFKNHYFINSRFVPFTAQ